MLAQAGEHPFQRQRGIPGRDDSFEQPTNRRYFPIMNQTATNTCREPSPCSTDSTDSNSLPAASVDVAATLASLERVAEEDFFWRVLLDGPIRRIDHRWQIALRLLDQPGSFARKYADDVVRETVRYLQKLERWPS